MKDKLLTRVQLQDRWTVSKWTIYKYTSQGMLPAVKVGGLRFRETDIEKFENEHFSGGVKTALL